MKEPNSQPRYIQIYEAVREDILSAVLKPAEKLPSIRAFAQQWSVSTITIIKAFDKLKEEGLVTTSERSGFFVAAGMQSNVHSKKIGFLVPVKPQDIHEHRNIHTACGALEGYADRNGHRLSVHLARWGVKGGGHAYLGPQIITEYGLDVAVLMDIYNYHYLSNLAELRIPILMLDADASNLGIDSVYFDNMHAAVQLTQALINKGHSHILFVGGPLPSALGVRKKMYADPATLQRLDGCRLVIEQRPDQRFLQTAFSRTDRTGKAWSAAAHQVLRDHPEITAIVSEAPLKLDDAFKDVKQAVFSAAQIENNPSIVAQAICDFQVLGAQAPDMLHQRLMEPLAPILRQAIAPRLLL